MSEKDIELKELEELSNQSETVVANKTVMITWTVLCSIISAAYLLEVVKGARTVGYVLTTVLLAMIPVVLGWTVYKKNNDSDKISYLMAIGFGLLYSFVLFTAQNDLVFSYAIPMLIVATLYNSKKYTTVCGSVVVIEIIATSVMNIMKAEDSKAILATIEIQVLLSIVIVFYLIAVSGANTRFSEIRMAGISLQEKKSQKLMDKILGISADMTKTIESVGYEMDGLKSSVDQTVSSMDEVSGGTAESADAVQRQLLKTEEIQNHVENVESAAKTIHENILNTGDAVREGTEHIKEMTKLTKEVDFAGKDVAEALSVFKETTSKMNTITDIITDVASETSLLSLNASIEAARAGDAGRGFAVVASEISGLATQTTEATDNIVAMINDISSQLDNMVATIQHLIKTGAEESRCAEQTKESFISISDNVNVIEKHSGELESVVKDLSDANREIVDSIQTISAITEEVTAHATETHEASILNQSIVDKINTMVSELSEDAIKLKA